METVITALIVYTIAFQLWALVLEMFLWTKPMGRAAFGTTAEQAENSKVLASNQGLYNGFLAAGLIVGLVSNDAEIAYAFKTFFLACVAVAGVYGGATASWRIFFLQGLAPTIALALLLS